MIKIKVTTNGADFSLQLSEAYIEFEGSDEVLIHECIAMLESIERNNDMYEIWCEAVSKYSAKRFERYMAQRRDS